MKMTEEGQGVSTSLGHLPAGERWAFDESVTKVFEDMLRRSIPNLDGMRGLVHEVASAYRQEGTTLVDLGASRGDAMAPLVEAYGDANRYALVEVSKPMAEVCRSRFDANRGVVVYETDLRSAYPPVRDASVTLSVLTLQFIPIEYRLKLLKRAYESTLPGGAFILVEKILGSSAEVNELLTKLYYCSKARNGYTQEEIDRKRVSLEGVLVPVTERWNVDLLTAAGFGPVECFWRSMNFAAWVAVKP